MKDRILSFSFFLFAFLMPFQGIPKVGLFGMNVRIGVIFYFPILLIALIDFWKVLHLLKPLLASKTSLSLVFFSLLSICITWFNEVDPRSIGFIIWLGVSVGFFYIAGIFKSSWIIKGFLVGQIFNLFYIILQFLLGEQNLFGMGKITFIGKFRAYGLTGEPSFLAISLVPLIIFSAKLKNHTWQFLLRCFLYFGVFFSFSRTALIGSFFTILVEFFLYRKQFTKITLIPVFIMALCSFAYNSSFYGVRGEIKKTVTKVNEKGDLIEKPYRKESHLRGYEEGTPPILAGSTKQRLLSLERGWTLFKERPFGVGLGNSHRELKKRFAEYTYWRNFPKNERWKARIDGLHNLFLEVAVETGVFGLLAFLMFLFFMAKDLFLFKLYNELAMFLGMLLTMQFAQNVNMPTMWIILSHCLVQIQKKVSVES